MMPKAEKVEIEGAKDVPLVGGCNFFTGEFKGEGFIEISGGLQPRDWEFFWRRHAGTEPPGPLPDGALAMLIAGGNGGEPTLMRPLKAALKDNVAHVDWLFTETGSGPSSYAILIVPGKDLKQTVTTVSVPATVQAMTSGADGGVSVMRPIKLRQSRGFLRV